MPPPTFRESQNERADMDFFFSYFSTYTYLSVMRIEALAQKARVPVNWRPFHLRTITTEQNNRPFVGKPVKMKYMWRDLERRAAQHGLEFNGIPPYPVDADLAHRVGTVAAMDAWCPAFSKAVYRHWFVDHIPPVDPEHLRRVVASLGKDPDQVMAQAESDEVRDRLLKETDTARSLGIFGSPTFSVGGEIFWGDDRLEVALDWK